MKSFFRKLVDSRDREVEAHLVLLCCGAFALIGLSIFHVVILHNAFDPNPFGQGLGCLMAGGGAAAWGQGMQQSSEQGVGEKGGSDESAQ